MHFAGSSDDDFDNRIMPEMAARTSPFPPPAAKIPLGLIVLQEAHMSPDFFQLQTAQLEEIGRLNKGRTSSPRPMILVLINLVILCGCAFCNRTKSRDK